MLSRKILEMLKTMMFDFFAILRLNHAEFVAQMAGTRLNIPHETCVRRARPQSPVSDPRRVSGFSIAFITGGDGR
jgi:hypothetical protein